MYLNYYQFYRVLVYPGVPYKVFTETHKIVQFVFPNWANELHNICDISSQKVWEALDQSAFI